MRLPRRATRPRAVLPAVVGGLVALALLVGLAPGVPTVTAASASTGGLHVVRPGQTLQSVARARGTTVTSLAAWNGLRTTSRIYPDGLLRLSPPASRLPAFAASISPVTAADLGASWRSGCPVGPSSLRAVKVRYLRFDATAATGDLVVHRDAVDETVAAFRGLYARRVPVQQIRPVAHYGGSDSRSMAANNTSAFNCRRTTSGTSWSEHSYGRAIDVNPVQNPYVKGRTVLPATGTCCTDRTRYRRGMLHLGGGVDPFVDNGFAWGGAWRTLKDYQHFSTTGR